MVDAMVPHGSTARPQIPPPCDLVTVPARQGMEAVDLLRLSPGGVGPVLHDRAGDSLAFLVPPGTASRWLGTGVRSAGLGTWIVVPYPGRSTGGVRWLVPPDGSGTLTDPALLELAMHEAAAGLATEGE